LEEPKTNYCDCKYIEWCHEPRQYVQSMVREENPSKTVKDCDFYKLIEEKENEDEQ